MKVLFIGGTGNISQPVSRLCVEKNIDLYLLNRGLSGSSVAGATVVNADINNEQSIKNKLKDHDWDVVVNWIAFTEHDVIRDYNLFSGKTKQYIFISSASAYQKPLQNPVITESTPLENPFWEYSRNKIACEKKLNELHQQNDFPVTIVRPSLTYDTVIPVAIGGWREYTIIDRMKKGKKIIVHGDGSSLWTITHAIDFAKGFIGLFGNDKAIGEAFHITSDELLTWDQIYTYTAEAAGVEPKIIHIASDFICAIENSLTGTLIGDKAVSAIFDNSKIKSFVTDFKTGISYREGIKETIKWFESDPVRMIVNPQTNTMMDRIISAYER
ncbi:MAG: SDR family oxidoreductase [Melioribacteraceae bacterium]|nr:SDR family oxidoreductase [Melioribacteraceae bacterium]MCF8354178.1 SDR family oxidoreductase [Melioribacteraceae bacterium]MCF8394716.1 SDR family oxidoreductase [Melioribacteraceae bacterium]MCF8418101.1 SDR family oxidoreductase [Melioribacteraceae bacterium]